MTKKVLKFDVMLGDMFYRTLRMPIKINMLRKVGNDIAVTLPTLSNMC